MRNAASLCALYIGSSTAVSERRRTAGAYASKRDRLHDNLLTFPHALFHCLHAHYVLVKASPTYDVTRLCNVVKTVTLLSHKSSNVPVKWFAATSHGYASANIIKILSIMCFHYSGEFIIFRSKII